MNKPHRILAVDDNVDNLAILEEFLAQDHEFKAVTSGEEALVVAPTFQPHLVLLDVMMRGIDGIETCRLIRIHPRLRDTKVIMLSARHEIGDRLSAYDVGAVDYIAKPFHDREVLFKVRNWIGSAQRSDVNRIWCDMEEAKDGIGRTLTSLIQLRDTETGEHLFRMRWYAQALAEQLAEIGPYSREIDELFLRRLYRASPLHDIGKVGVEDAILRKPGWLTPEEFEAIKQHTTIGAKILEHAVTNLPYADYLPMAVDIARHHHERFDGTGYPDRLAGYAIPLAARIVSVADVFDAVTSDRVYRKAMSMEQAVQVVEQGAGTLFDEAIVDAFRTRLDDFKQGQARFRLIERSRDGTAEWIGGESLASAADAHVDHRENNVQGDATPVA